MCPPESVVNGLGENNVITTTHDSVMFRIYEATGTRNQVGLAAWLDVRQSAISDAKRRNRIPAEWLKAILLRTNYNPDWIMTGQGNPTFPNWMLVLQPENKA